MLKNSAVASRMFDKVQTIRDLETQYAAILVFDEARVPEALTSEILLGKTLEERRREIETTIGKMREAGDAEQANTLKEQMTSDWCVPPKEVVDITEREVPKINNYLPPDEYEIELQDGNLA